jgi:hypothetical protein
MNHQPQIRHSRAGEDSAKDEFNCNRPFEARKRSHLRVRDFINVPHPEAPALAGLEGLVAANAEFRSGLADGLVVCASIANREFAN